MTSKKQQKLKMFKDDVQVKLECPDMCKVRAKSIGFYGNAIIEAGKEFMIDSKFANATWLEKI